MLRSFWKWWWYPALMVGAMIVASLPSTMSTATDDSVKPTDDFVVRSFEGDYTLVEGAGGRTDVKVKETFVVVFNRSYTNRGIVRLIPMTYQLHLNTVDGISVTGSVRTVASGSERTGTPPDTTQLVDSVLALRIGDASRYVVSGVPQAYEIHYTLGDLVAPVRRERAQRL